jgi:hypothetical protein
VIHRISWPATVLLAALVLGGCSEHAEKTAERSVSPLIGTWTRDGNVVKGGNGGPQFTKLTFASSGSLQAIYVAGGIGTLVGSSPALKSENDTYKTPAASTLSIAEGTTELTYTYRVSGSKLYLTPRGGSDAAVFSKSA